MSHFLAIGSAHWDILGRTSQIMALHDDVGGQIRRLIGGVAGPIAMKLAQKGVPIELICYAGHDEFGEALLAKLHEYNVSTKHCLRGKLPTDIYMGIEAPNGLIAAIADCHSLEAMSIEAVKRLKSFSTNQTHLIVDGNLQEDALISLAKGNYTYKQLTLIPASPGKILRLKPFMGTSSAQIIVNLREANALLGANLSKTADAATALADQGFASALVSNGSEPASFANGQNCVSATPPSVEVKRFTGAGDTLAAHFLWAQSQGQDHQNALETALNATSEFISVEDLDV